MLFDIIYGIVLILAIWKGFRMGLIVGLFSLVAVMIGLAAAMKLSVVAAGYIGAHVNVSAQWLPLISFLVVFIIVILLVRLGAKAIEKTVQLAMLGWINRIGGILLFAILYTIIFSIIVFYLEGMHIINAKTTDHSLTYQYVQPVGPKVINAFGKLVPWFRDMFSSLQDFFGKMATHQSSR